MRIRTSHNQDWGWLGARPLEWKRRSSLSILIVLGISLVFCGMSLGAAKKVLGKPSMQSVMTSILHKELVQYLQQQVPSSGIRLETRLVSPTKPVVVPRGKLSLKVVPSPLSGRTGRRVFRIEMYVDNRLAKTVNVIEEIQAVSLVVLPVRWIKAHDIIEPSDVKIEKRHLTSLHEDIIFHKSQAVGKKAQRSLSPNQPIQRSFLTLPPIIHKGDRVIIKARSGGLLVQTTGIAKASGGKGKTISVENLQSHRKVLGRIVAPGMVEVTF